MYNKACVITLYERFSFLFYFLHNAQCFLPTRTTTAAAKGEEFVAPSVCKHDGQKKLPQKHQTKGPKWQPACFVLAFRSDIQGYFTDEANLAMRSRHEQTNSDYKRRHETSHRCVLFEFFFNTVARTDIDSYCGLMWGAYSAFIVRSA